MATKKRRSGCKRVTFNRGKRDQKTVTLCGSGKKKGGKRRSSGKRCHLGGPGYKAKVRANMRALPKHPTKRQRAQALKPAQFTSCG